MQEQVWQTGSEETREVSAGSCHKRVVVVVVCLCLRVAVGRVLLTCLLQAVFTPASLQADVRRL